MTCDVNHLFICLPASCISSFVRCLFRSLHILDNSLLSNVSFATILFHSGARLFILLALSFTKHNFLILMKSSLSIILFKDHAFGILSKMSLWYLKSYSSFSMLSSKSFIVLCIKYKVMIYIRLIFVKGMGMRK